MNPRVNLKTVHILNHISTSFLFQNFCVFLIVLFSDSEFVPVLLDFSKVYYGRIKQSKDGKHEDFEDIFDG